MYIHNALVRMQGVPCQFIIKLAGQDFKLQSSQAEAFQQNKGCQPRATVDTPNAIDLLGLFHLVLEVFHSIPVEVLRITRFLIACLCFFGTVNEEQLMHRKTMDTRFLSQRIDLLPGITFS